MMAPTLWHVWPAKRREGRECHYTGQSLEQAAVAIRNLVDVKHTPAAVASVRNDGVVLMTLFEIPKARGPA